MGRPGNIQIWDGTTTSHVLTPPITQGWEFLGSGNIAEEPLTPQNEICFRMEFSLDGTVVAL